MNTNWQNLLEQARQIATRSMGDLYERVKILSKIFDDPEYKKQMIKDGRDAAQVLNEEVGDIAVADFVELYHIAKLFPNKEQWANGNLRAMRQTLLASLQPKAGDKKPKQETNVRMSWKEKYIEMEKENAILKQRIKDLEGQLRDFRRMFGKKKATA